MKVTQLVWTLISHGLHFYSLAPMRYKCVCMPYYHALSCSSSQRHSMDCRVEQATMSNQILWWHPKSSNLCAALHCLAEARFLLDSCEGKLIRNASQVLCPDIGIVVDCLPSQQCNQKNHTFTVPEDSDHHPYLWRRLHEFFFRTNWAWCQSMDWLLLPIQNNERRLHLL